MSDRVRIGNLQLIKAKNGDIYVGVYSHIYAHGEDFHSACSRDLPPKSGKTIKALRDLYRAMKADQAKAAKQAREKL